MRTSFANDDGSHSCSGCPSWAAGLLLAHMPATSGWIYVNRCREACRCLVCIACPGGLLDFLCTATCAKRKAPR